MAGSVNRATILGNLGRDPEVKSLQDGKKVVTLSVATTENWTDKGSGEKRERTEWHRVTIWNENLAGVAERYLRKGSKVYLEGAIETRKWQDQAGQDRYSTEIVLRPYRGELVLLGERAGAEGGAEPPRQSSSGAQYSRAAKDQHTPRPRQEEHLSEEIPF